jgi:hypothetical protein
VKGIQVYSNKGPGPLQRGDNHKKLKMGWGHLNFLLQNHKANFNQTWHKSSLKGGDSSFVQRKGIAPLQGEKYTENF